MEEQLIFFATCSRYVEEILEEELNDLGIEQTTALRGGVQFETTIENALRAVVHTRTCGRIYKLIKEHTIDSQDDIYKNGMDLDWTKIFSIHQTFKVSTLFDSKAKDFFNNSLIMSLKLKDAIVDVFRNKTEKRPNIEKANPDIRFLQRIEKQNDCFVAYLYMDLSGTALNYRGYRAPGHLSPLRETLAAAILILADQKENKESFVDCFCGTGTFLIEAWMLRENIPPTYLKIMSCIENKKAVFSFQKQTWYKKNRHLNNWFNEYLLSEYAEIKKKLTNSDSAKIYGSDISKKNIDICKDNLKKAKILNRVELQVSDALDMNPVDTSGGVLVCNPPYGERSGETDEELEELYFQLGEHFKHDFNNYKCFIFTSRSDLRKKIRLKTAKKIQLFNGNLDCRLFQYNIY
jgi:23S rRNA G2445 N2-methylase RlmL